MIVEHLLKKVLLYFLLEQINELETKNISLQTQIDERTTEFEELSLQNTQLRDQLEQAHSKDVDVDGGNTQMNTGKSRVYM